MLKILPPLNLIQQPKAKCGEIFCHSRSDFTIYCSFCNIKLFAFEDFLLHIQNIHFENNVLKTETATEVCETVTKINVFNKIAKVEDTKNQKEFESDNSYEYDDNDFEDTSSDFEDESSDGSLLKVLYEMPARAPRKRRKRLKDKTKSRKEKEQAEGDEETISNSSDKPEKILRVQEFSCAECDEPFRRIKHLDQHVFEHHNGYKCSICDKRYRHQSLYKTHLESHSIEKQNLPCPKTTCNRTFANQEKLDRHLEVHTLEPTFVCDFENCGKAFPTQLRLKTHMNAHKKKNVCDICGYSCKAFATLVIHKRVHTGERPFPCEVCDKRFISKAAINEHMATHSSERPFVCEICQAAFTNFKALHRHRKTHTTERNYKCKLCDKAFKTYNGLDNHMRNMHREPKPTDVEEELLQQEDINPPENVEIYLPKKKRRKGNLIPKKFKCSVCCKGFKRLNGLDNHMRHFHGETDSKTIEKYENADKKKYQCNICNKKFTSLARHSLTHNDEKKFECKLCETTFKTYNGLVGHMLRMHEDSNTATDNKDVSNNESLEENGLDLS